MGTQLTMSITFHPQTDGQSEMTIQILEDMLQACALDHKGSWDEHLPLVEFAYNNSYQESIQMAPYEALYGRPADHLFARQRWGRALSLVRILLETPRRRWV